MKPTLLTLLLLLAPLLVLHAQTEEPLTMGRRINLAARQRMLSQRMAKNYVYLWRKVNEAPARQQLQESIDAFEQTLQLFEKQPLSPIVQEKVAASRTAFTAYRKVLTEPSLPIDIVPFMKQVNEMLLVTDALVKEIEKYARAQPGFNADVKVDSRRSIVNVTGRQRMLSQRVTAFYAAYEANPNNEFLKTTLLEAVKAMQDDWVAIQQFVVADADGLATITANPDFREMVTQRKAFEEILEKIKQNQRVDLSPLWLTGNNLVAILDKVVMLSETLMAKGGK